MANRKGRTPQAVRNPPEDSWILEGDDEGANSDPNYEDEDPDTSSLHDNDAALAEDHDKLSPLRPSSLSSSAAQSGSPEAIRNGPTSPRSSPPAKGIRPSSRQSTREPDLVMPSMSSSHASGSWIGGNSMAASSRLRKGPKPSGGKRQGDSRKSGHTHKGQNAPDNPQDRDAAFRSMLFNIYEQFILPVLRLFLSIIFTMVAFFKPVLVILATLWITLFLFSRYGTYALRYTLAPICTIPGASYLNLPFCSIPQYSNPPEFDQLITVQSAFEDVLAASAGGGSLPVDMKRSEASIRDLKHVVGYSTLPSRNELVFEFEGFIQTARQASGDLNRFNSRIGRAVDQVLSINRWTLQVLDGVAEREESRGGINHFLDNTILLPFRHPKVTESILLDQYIRHAQGIEEQIAELILEAQALLGILQNLDDRLDVIHSITTRDGIRVKGDRDELFAHLWTWLGGNRGEVKKSDQQLILLRQVAIYRKTAWDHVSGTVIKLESIAAGLEDLRERVGRPEVLGYRDDLPLRVHIENIQMGVERLEQQRLESRRMEGESYRRILDRGVGPGDEKRVIDAS